MTLILALARQTYLHLPGSHAGFWQSPRILSREESSGAGQAGLTSDTAHHPAAREVHHTRWQRSVGRNQRGLGVLRTIPTATDERLDCKTCMCCGDTRWVAYSPGGPKPLDKGNAAVVRNRQASYVLGHNCRIMSLLSCNKVRRQVPGDTSLTQTTGGERLGLCPDTGLQARSPAGRRCRAS